MLAAVVVAGGLTATVATAQESEPGPTTPVEVPADPAPTPTEETPTEETPTEETPTDEPGQPVGEDQSDAPADDTPAEDPPAEIDEPSIAAVTDVALSVVVDRGPYLPGAPVPYTVVVTNAGPDDATGVRLEIPFSPSKPLYADFGDFSPYGPGPGGTVPAGDEVRLDVIGYSSLVDGVSTTRVVANAPGDSDLSDNEVTFEVEFDDPGTTHDVTGQVYADLDADGGYDEGEELQGVAVDLRVTPRDLLLQTVTDADGRFAFIAVPVGRATLSWENVPDGWVLPYLGGFLLGVDDTTGIEVRGQRQFGDLLDASLRFTEDSYEAGDTATVRIALTNVTASPVRDVQLSCNRSGEGPGLVGWQDWEPLAFPGSGVTLAPHETQHHEFQGRVPGNAADWGHVHLYCDFGWDTGATTNAEAGDTAAVTGGEPADQPMTFFHDIDDDYVVDDGEAVAGLLVRITDRHDPAVNATRRADADGRVVFTGMPAGLYDVQLFGPWRFLEGADDRGKQSLSIGACCTGEPFYRVEPGPDVPEPADPTKPPPAQGGPVPGGSGGLAATGADVLWLAGGGAVALLIGVGAIMLTRRRKDAPPDEA